jgi:2-keto-4-pentenoate hydratase/2-oxohepta-3-ene-1,7-dioic acid hydratase in catechol pathway
MKLCHYSFSPMNSNLGGESSRLAILHQEHLLVDVQHVAEYFYEQNNYYRPHERAQFQTPNQLSDFLFQVDEPLTKLQYFFELFLKAQKKGDWKTQRGAALFFDLRDRAKNEITFKAPLNNIRTYRDFFTHEKHVEKGFQKRGEKIPDAWFEMPVYYKGATTGFIGPQETIPWPRFSQQLDYELELACVIGKDGKNLTEANALKHIFGWTILNDVSARDIQRKEMSVRLGPAKGKDWCSVIGPVIVTADEFKFQEPDLFMTASINGVEWSRGRSSEAYFTWKRMLQHLTQEEWVLAGDLLGSGTVGTGCGLELDRWIKPGDEITLEIEHIGKLTNTVGFPV